MFYKNSNVDVWYFSKYGSVLPPQRTSYNKPTNQKQSPDVLYKKSYS